MLSVKFIKSLFHPKTYHEYLYVELAIIIQVKINVESFKFWWYETSTIMIFFLFSLLS